MEADAAKAIGAGIACLGMGGAGIGLGHIFGQYLAGALRSGRAGTLAAGTIASVYGLLYLLVLSEQYALLLGALLVFGVLAAIMLVTRRLDWHVLGAKE